MSDLFVSFVIFFIIGCIVGALPSALIGFVLAEIQLARHQSSSEAAAEAKRKSPEYLRRLALWEQAYYCHKHDAVILDDGKVLSPTEFGSQMLDTG